ncbi:MAG: polyprenyl diphosphate synthase [Bacilli bacterium]
MNPKHVGIIMDGNGRWAKERGRERTYGHQKGVENLKNLCLYIFKQKIEIISVYCFSTENFKRPQSEVNFLMNLFTDSFHHLFREYKEKNIKIVFSGRREGLAQGVLDAMDSITDYTKENTGGILNLCLNYGGQYEIIDAFKKMKELNVDLTDLDPTTFMHYFYQDLPPVDFVIRTGGEKRLSNFMLYQASYAEFYFPDTYFPSFDEKEFDLALDAYHHRDRRFGNIKE